MGIDLIWEKYKNPLRGYIQTKVSDYQLSDMILQKVYSKVELNMDELSEVNNFDHWIYQLANNTICDYYLDQS